MTATPLSLMLQITGLSQREASSFLNVSTSAIDKMARGVRSTPAGIMAELYELHAMQRRAADEAIAKISSLPADAVIQLGLASDDHEAQLPPLGWPCVGAQAGMLAMVVAALPDRRFQIIPRGSTAASAGAADAHEKPS